MVGLDGEDEGKSGDQAGENSTDPPNYIVEK